MATLKIENLTLFSATLHKPLAISMTKRVKLSYKYCPHCKKDCNIKTYKEHRRLFFDSELKTWYHAAPSQVAERDVESDSESSNSIPSNDSSDDFDEGGTLDEVETGIASDVAFTGL